MDNTWLNNTKLKTNEMSMIPKTPTEDEYLEMRIPYDHLKLNHTHEMSINFRHPKLYQPRMNKVCSEFHVAIEN